MANLPEDKKWTEVYLWETGDRALGGPDSQFTKPIRDLTTRTGYLKEQVEKGNSALTAHEKSTNHPDATTASKGFVKPSSAVDSTSEALAATPKAVKTAMDKANSATSAASAAQTTANTANSTANTAKTNAATAQSKADSAYSLASTANTTASSAKSTAETDASTIAKGRVQFNSAVNSTVENQAATPGAVKKAYDLAAKATANSYITEIYKSPDGLNWYRKWSGGFIEQGGYVSLTGNVKTINLLTPMATNVYKVSANSSSPTSNNTYAAYAQVNEKKLIRIFITIR